LRTPHASWIGAKMTTESKQSPRLQWVDGRWHCAGRGIHAGDAMELLCPDRHWLPVQIESRDAGRRLIAYFTCHGLEIPWALVESDPLRWPEKC